MARPLRPGVDEEPGATAQPRRHEKQLLVFHGYVRLIREDAFSAAYFLTTLPSSLQPDARRLAAKLMVTIERVLERLEQTPRGDDKDDD